jgi:hypothetical protein
LAQLEDARATPVLRRLADARTHGARAAAAVRAIETARGS